MRLLHWLRRKCLTWTDFLEDRSQAVPMQFGFTEERVREIVREEMTRAMRSTGRRVPGRAGSMT